MGRMPLTAEEKKILTRLGRSVRRLREAAGHTQEQLAEKADLNPRTIQKIEAGRLNILATTLHRIGSALRVKADKLLDE